MTRKILISRDVVFIEDQKLNEHIIEEPKNFDQFIIDLDSVKDLTHNENQDNNIEEEILLDSNVTSEAYISAEEDLGFEVSNHSDTTHQEEQEEAPVVRRSERIPKPKLDEDFIYVVNAKTLDDPETVEEAFNRADAKF